MMIRSHAFRLLPLMMAAVFMASCSGSPGGTGSQAGVIPQAQQSQLLQGQQERAEKPEISLAPASLTFSVGSASQTFVATVRDRRTLFASSSNTSCAVVTPASVKPTHVEGKHREDGDEGEDSKFVATFTVSAAAAGDCSITVSGKGDKDAEASVAVHVNAAPKLYVENAGNNTVTIYDAPFDSSSNASTTLSSGLNNPVGSAFDVAGNLYVTNYGGSTVTVFSAPFSNASTPSVTDANGMGGPQDLAFDASGNLYVSNNDSNTLSVYSAPFTASSAPTVTLTGTNGLYLPQQIAFDSGGNLYVANRGGSVTVYASPLTAASMPIATITNGVHGTRGVAFDSSGNLYVANCSACGGGGSPDGIAIYHQPFNNSSSPVATIASGLSQPYGITFDAAGNLYVANAGNNTVVVYGPPFGNASTPSSTISNGMNAPVGVQIH